MARPLRVDYPGAWHHVMNRGARRQAIFLDDGDRWRFLELLGQIEERYGVAVNAYCMLGNHYHLLAQSLWGELSRAIRHLDGLFAQRFNVEHGLDGPLFRGRFKSRLVEDGEYLRHLLGYIHQNPVEAGIVDRPEAYQWSSLPHLLGSGSTKPDWLRTDALQLAGIANRRELMAATNETSPMPPLIDEPGPALYGSAQFVAEHMRLVEDLRESPGLRNELASRPTLDDVISAVCREWGVPRRELVTPRPGRRSDARSMAIGLAHEMSGETLSSVAAAFGLAHERSAGSRTDRYRTLLSGTGFASRDRRVRQRLVGDMQSPVSKLE